jgi:hypothetical protein
MFGSSLRNGDGGIFFHRRGLEELALLRQAIRNDWGVRPEVIRQVGPVLDEMLRGDDNRCKVAAIRTLIAIESLVASDFRAAMEFQTAEALRELQAKACAQEDLIRQLQARDGCSASLADDQLLDDRH